MHAWRFEDAGELTPRLQAGFPRHLEGPDVGESGAAVVAATVHGRVGTPLPGVFGIPAEEVAGPFRRYKIAPAYEESTLADLLEFLNPGRPLPFDKFLDALIKLPLLL